MNPATNQTTIHQGRRLLAAGCPFVKVHMDGHKIMPEPIPLGRLWDIAHGLGLEYEFPLELTSNELTEALVADIEKHYRNETKLYIRNCIKTSANHYSSYRSGFNIVCRDNRRKNLIDSSSGTRGPGTGREGGKDAHRARGRRDAGSM